jgi:hypothetical protein
VSIQLFNRYQSSAVAQKRAVAQKVSGLILISALTACSPIAESILKTSRFASARPNTPIGPTQAVLDPRSPLEEGGEWRTDFSYLSELVDASEWASYVNEADSALNLRSVPHSASGLGSDDVATASESRAALNHSATQTIEIALNEEQLDEFREEGSVEINLPSVGESWQLEKVRARFHVIQSELELIEGDEDFSTSASIRTHDQNLTIRVSVKGSIEDPNVHSTLSRLVRLELELESKGKVACATSRAAGGVIDPSRHE